MTHGPFGIIDREQGIRTRGWSQIQLPYGGIIGVRHHSEGPFCLEHPGTRAEAMLKAIPIESRRIGQGIIAFGDHPKKRFSPVEVERENRALGLGFRQNQEIVLPWHRGDLPRNFRS